jgi:hypothetical protein
MVDDVEVVEVQRELGHKLDLVCLCCSRFAMTYGSFEEWKTSIPFRCAPHTKIIIAHISRCKIPLLTFLPRFLCVPLALILAFGLTATSKIHNIYILRLFTYNYLCSKGWKR